MQKSAVAEKALVRFSIGLTEQGSFSDTVSTETPLAAPSIPDYDLIRIVGRGSYGDVWLARGITGVLRAVKIVWRTRFADPQPYEREFKGLKEFAAVSLLEPRQLALLHVSRNEAAGFFYYVMELADDADSGREIDPLNYRPNTLREVRSRRGRLPVKEVVSIGAEIARGLAGLHRRGLVHRDIKPSNVIFVGGSPKLADIGLVATASADLTFVGTEGYVPPEGPGIPSADVYSLGKMLYELATGLDRHDYPRLPADLDQISDRKELLEINEVCIRACQSEPTKRHPDAEALLGDLLLLQAGKSVRKLRAEERRLARALRATVVLTIALTIAATGAWIAQSRAEREMDLRAKAESERDALRRESTYLASLSLAQRAIDNDELLRARQLLEDIQPSPGQPDLRSFEWGALWHAARGDPRTEIKRDGPEISALALSTDETLLAVHDRSNELTLYDSFDHRALVRILGVRQLGGFSSDDKWLFGTDSNDALSRWSTSTGLISEPPGPAIGMPISAVGNSGVLAISDGVNAALRGWDFLANEEFLRLNLGPHDSASPWMTFRYSKNVNNQTIVHAWRKGTGSSSQFRVTCIRLGALPKIFHHETGRAVPTAVGVDRRGAWAFLDSRDPLLAGEVWRCNSGGWHRTEEFLPQDTRKVLELDHGGPFTVIVQRGRQLTWLTEKKHNAAGISARGHNTLLTDFVVSNKYGHAFSGSTDGSLIRWSLEGPPARKFQGWDSLGGTTNLVFTADGRSVWVPETGSTCIRLDVATLTPMARAEGMVYPLSLHGDTLVGVGVEPGLLRVNAFSGVLVDRIMISDAPVRVAAASSDGSKFALIDHAGFLFRFGVLGPERVEVSLHRHYKILLTEDGSRLLSVSSNPRELRCWSWPDGRVLWQKQLPALASDLLVLPGSTTVILTLENGTLEYRKVESGELELPTSLSKNPLRLASAAPQAMALIPDGSRLLVAGVEGDVQCIKMQTGQQVHSFPLGQGQTLHRMVCAHDGKTVGILTRTGLLHLLRAD